MLPSPGAQHRGIRGWLDRLRGRAHRGRRSSALADRGVLAFEHAFALPVAVAAPQAPRGRSLTEATFGERDPRAHGHTYGQTRFTREQQLTAAVLVGGDRPSTPWQGSGETERR
ncbi:hypothetical protein Snoj_00590 [Streptomyces nojiriensis]|uniref:Uncharacterized protein n=1 Tax=Streptomyces nojiriensis TaxID=66374 RepID=A0ABQ3SDD1_9ACTN|nr:hypothetical protein GCM10010205_76190 [Streptomyces nojiriensis]GHI66141.1 hypothetical protein Snoj_00590 [Streptomyces nojiriensis]